MAFQTALLFFCYFALEVTDDDQQRAYRAHKNDSMT